LLSFVSPVLLSVAGFGTSAEVVGYGFPVTQEVDLNLPKCAKAQDFAFVIHDDLLIRQIKKRRAGLTLAPPRENERGRLTPFT
jgi:hypothetical protein